MKLLKEITEIAPNISGMGAEILIDHKEKVPDPKILSTIKTSVPLDSSELTTLPSIQSPDESAFNVMPGVNNFPT